MRSSAVLCIALLAAAAPSLAAPSTLPQYSKRSETGASKGSTLWSPQYYPNRVVPGRYHGSWPSSGYQTYKARADIDLQSGASFWSGLVSALPTIVNVASKIFAKRDVHDFSAREFEEVFARELEQEFAREMHLAARDLDESGAIKWGNLLKSIPSIVGTVGTWFKRGQLEAIIQARDDLESGAWNWGKFASSIPSLIGTVGSWFKREDLEALLQARDDLESGAWDWGKFASSIPSIIGTVGSWFKREELEEFLARAALEARSLNDLD